MTFCITARKVDTMEVPNEVIRAWILNYFIINKDECEKSVEELCSMTMEELVEEFGDLDYLYNEFKDEYAIQERSYSHKMMYLDEAYEDMEFSLH